jgi:hypothetical protein
MSVEFTIEGLSPKQMALADIMWGLDGFDEVQAFIKTLPKREQTECHTIIELMKMAMIEQCYDGISELTEAKTLLNQFKL